MMTQQKWLCCIIYTVIEYDKLFNRTTNFFKSISSSKLTGLLKEVMIIMTTSCIHTFFDRCTINFSQLETNTK